MNNCHDDHNQWESILWWRRKLGISWSNLFEHCGWKVDERNTLTFPIDGSIMIDHDWSDWTVFRGVCRFPSWTCESMMADPTPATRLQKERRRLTSMICLTTCFCGFFDWLLTLSRKWHKTHDEWWVTLFSSRASKIATELLHLTQNNCVKPFFPLFDSRHFACFVTLRAAQKQ